MEKEIITGVKNSIREVYYKNYKFFYNWVSINSNDDFFYTYEHIFKKYKKENENVMYYTNNLSLALWAFYETERNIPKLLKFVSKFIKGQLIN